MTSDQISHRFLCSCVRAS